MSESNPVLPPAATPGPAPADAGTPAADPGSATPPRSEREIERASWADKVHEQVARIGALLAKDVVAHIRRAARDAFARSDRADLLPDADLAVLKGEIEILADHMGPWVTGEFGTHDWIGEPDLGADADLGAVPLVQQTLAAVDSELTRVLHDAGLGDPPLWSLPRRFIDGDDLVSLTRGLVKYIAHHRRLDAEVQRAVVHQTSAERARRWDEA